MNTFLCRWNVAIVCLFLCGVTSAVASEPPEPIDTAETVDGVAGSPVAEIDMARVFLHYNDFKRKQEELKLEVKRIDGEIRTAKKGIMELRRRSIDLPDGSEQAKTMSRAIESLTEGVKNRIDVAKTSLMDREAALYWESYQEVVRVVTAYAREHHIRMVVRKQAPPADDTNREAILKAVQRFIVFADDCDITDEIITALNQ